jgi:N-acetylneuraminate synthase
MSALGQLPPSIIAEIGCNHKGDIGIAEELIQTAKICGADVAKFQKRAVKELLSDEEYRRPHPNPNHAYGATYGEHREFLELSIEQHARLQQACRKVGIEYSTSVWDVISARQVIELAPRLIKVPSASNADFELLQVLRDDYRGEVHCSVGMTTRKEEDALVAFFEEKRQARERLVLYSCTSGYPVPFEDICLLEITRLKKAYDHRVLAIGFSGHHLGIAADVAALTLGVRWIERHFTLDRTWRGTDHAASLEPEGLRRLCRDIKNVSKALTYKPIEVLPIEDTQRLKLKRKVKV